jgi:hypothetical protein
MPENQIPATQPEPGAAPGEFNFAKPVTENPRIRRRSLKAKPGSLLKPITSAPSATREPEREAPPLSDEPVVKPRGISEVAVTEGRVPRATAENDPRSEIAGYQQKPKQDSTQEVKVAPTVKIAATTPAPPKVTPSLASTSSRPASGVTATPKIASTVSPAISPHGTRPATLYYSSQPRKDTEAILPMKTIPTASPAPSSSASSATTTLPSSVARAATSSPRPASTVDYRANVERQSREQKSVGSLLSYVVYALIGFFVISAGLAGYGSYVIFQRLHDQSQTVSDLDARYAAANKDLNAKLATTQDTLSQAQAQIARQQDLILKQQEELNRLIAATSDNASALKTEKQARAQETASLRARVRDLEDRSTYTQKY